MQFFLLSVLSALAAAISDYTTCDGDATKVCFATADCGTSGCTGAVACNSAATTPVPTTTKTAATCVDLLNPLTGVSDCPARAPLCTSIVYLDVMSVQCPRTCGFCTSSGTSTNSTSISTCVDLLNPITGVSDCPARASLCTNTVYLDVMRVQCPRTCGFCTSSGTSTNIVMRVQCPRTCGFCNSSGTSTNIEPCPTVPQHTTGGIPSAETEAIPLPTMSNGDTIYRCKAPKGKLFKVPNGDPTVAVHLGTSAIIKCKRQSGKIFLNEGAIETEIEPAGTVKYTCGEFSCALCDHTKIVEPTAAACATQTDFLCKSKPIVTITANCPKLSCPTGESLYLLQTATTAIPVAEGRVMCDPTSKSWLYDGTNPIDAAAPGFVCATTCKLQCDAPVTDAYSNMDTNIVDILMNPSAMQPTCTYKCPIGFSLTVSGQARTSVVCNIYTSALTADTPTGTAISAANKFSCATCSCPTTALNDGSTGLCPKGFLCTNPTPGTACDATCPTGSMAIYNDASGTLKTSPTLKCAGADWITTGKATADVACMFLPGTGFVTSPATPPGTTACTPLTELPCPGTTCQFAELIYVKRDVGYLVMCKTGSLATDAAGTQLVSPCDGGVWTEGITKATCVQDASQVAACMAELDPAVASLVSHSCELGVCYISCSDSAKQFEYTVNYGAGPVMERNKLMKCHEKAPAPINLLFTDGMLIKCV